MVHLNAIIFLILLASSVTDGKSDKVTFEVEYREGGGRKVVKKDAEGRSTTIYETDRKITGRGPMLSPNGRYVVFTEEAEPGVIEDGGYKIPPRNRMGVCDTGGAVLRIVGDDGRRISWVPNGGRRA